MPARLCHFIFFYFKVKSKKLVKVGNYDLFALHICYENFVSLHITFLFMTFEIRSFLDFHKQKKEKKTKWICDFSHEFLGCSFLLRGAFRFFFKKRHSLYARLNSHLKAWSYKIKKEKKR